MIKKIFFFGIKVSCSVFLAVHLVFIFGVGDVRAKEYPELEYPRCISKMLTPDETTELLNSLRKKEWDDSLLIRYFGKECKDPELANLVIYIDSTGVVRKLDLFGQRKKVERLFGAKYIFVLIFSEIDLNTEVKTEKEDKKEAAFGVRLTPLNYPRDPGEMGLLSAIGSLFSLGGLGFAEKELKIQQDTIQLWRISSKNSSPLYAGMKSFTLENRTKNRITLWPLMKKDFLQISEEDVNFDILIPWLKKNLEPQPPEITLLMNVMEKEVKDLKDKLGKYHKHNLLEKDRKQIENDIVKALNAFERAYKGHLKDIIPDESFKERFTKVRDVSCTFGNYSKSWVGVSLGWSPNKEELYLLGHIYPYRPRIPRPSGGEFWDRVKQKATISLFVGTNVTGDKKLKDFSVGLSIGHLVGYWGVFIGIQDLKDKVKKSKGFFGINYMF